MSCPFLIEVMIEPKMKADQELLDAALAQLMADDPFLGFSKDEQSGAMVLKGIDERQLDMKVNVLRDVYKIGFNCGAPQIAYRETLAKPVEIEETHNKQIGQFARVKMIFEPNGPGAGSSFQSNIVSGALPKDYIPGVEKGINSVMASGILAGFPIVDVKVRLIDGAFHDKDSSVQAFEIVSRKAFWRALKEGGSILLEPIMKVEVTTPEIYVGPLASDFLSRRGKVQGQEKRDDAVTVDARVPLAHMYGYANQLRSFSQGRATYTMQFDHYAPTSSPNGDGSFPPVVGMRM